MAGSLQMVASAIEPFGCSSASAGDRWEVQFSRFVIHRSSLFSACPHLVPLRRDHRKKSTRTGTWLSSVSPASLQLLDSGCEDGAILTVFLGEKMMVLQLMISSAMFTYALEEHFISKLHFTWPQVSCMSGFPARGGRAVFVSYRDCADEVQKFAVRFRTTCEAETFTDVLRKSLHSLNDAAEVELLSPPVASEISSHSEFVPFNSLPHRCQEKLDDLSPSKQEPKTEQCANHKETVHNHDAEVPLAVYPPSFISLLTSCQSEAEKTKTQSTSSLDPSLRSKIMMYMEDSAFQEMLMTVDKVIEDLGTDSSVQSHKPSQITW